VARDPLTPPPWQGGSDAWGPQAAYLAPELTQPGKEPDARSDIYSLGCTLYQMLTGQPPRAREVPAANRVNPDVPAELAALVARLMSHDPRSRPQKALEVADLLSGRRASPAPVSDVPPPSETLDSPDEGAVLAVSETATAESGLPIVVTPAAGAVSARTRLTAKRSRNRMPLAISGLALILVVAAAALAYLKFRPASEGTDNRAASSVQGETAPGALAAKVPSVAEETTPAPQPQGLEGELWASPTSGPPLDLRYLPPGALVVVALRPAVLLAHPEGAKALDALGPLGELARGRLPELTGIELADMDQALVGFLDRAPDPPAVAVVVRTAAALSETDLVGRWGNPKLDDAASGRLFRGEDRAFFLPPGGNQRLLAIMPLKDVQDVLDMGDQPPLLRIEVEKLARASDADRAVSVLFTPDFLLMPSNSFLSGAAAQLKVPLQDFLGSEVKAGLLSCHLDGPNFFVELLVSPAVDRPPMSISKTLQDRVHAARLRVEDYVRPMTADPYAGKVLFRFPQMLAELEKHTRAAVIDRQVALRSYLPDRAAHNLALAAELALTSSGSAGAATVVAAAPPAAPKSVEERLKQVTSLSFPLENLENAIATLSAEIGVEMKILGADLELEGITRNQQFKDLNEVNKPADEILRQILIKARPDGKLVYVIGKDGERDVVYITIRSKAQERGQLPPELAQ
jgi:hypothetical protein